VLGGTIERGTTDSSVSCLNSSCVSVSRLSIKFSYFCFVDFDLLCSILLICLQDLLKVLVFSNPSPILILRISLLVFGYLSFELIDAFKADSLWYLIDL